MSTPKQRVLTVSYSGYLERYNPLSTNREKITVGLPGDVIEVHSTWRDLKTESTWLQVEIDGAHGWLLENETSPRPGE
jgi:hypothetical protein